MHPRTRDVFPKGKNHSASLFRVLGGDRRPRFGYCVRNKKGYSPLVVQGSGAQVWGWNSAISALCSVRVSVEEKIDLDP
jgi:hypothetical protein